MQPIEISQARKLLIWTVLVVHMLMAIALLLSKVSLAPETTAYFYFLIGALFMLQLYVYWRKMKPLLPVMDTLIAFFLVTIPAFVLSYVAISFEMPLADRELAALDTAIGFDWQAFIAFVDHRPWLAFALRHAYASLYYQVFLLPVYFALLGNLTRAYAIVFCYTLVLLICCFVSIWYPALGAYPTYGVGIDRLSSIHAKFGYYFLEQFHAVRDQPEFVLNFMTAAGILTFPSAHAAVAGICVWAGWESRLLRFPILALNIVMAASAVSDGSHYLIDVVAGIGVAGIAVSITTVLFYRQSTTRSFVLDQVRYVGAFITLNERTRGRLWARVNAKESR